MLFSIQGPTNSTFSSISGGSTGITTANLTAASILPSLQFILQQNSTQRVSLSLYFLPFNVVILCLKIFISFFLYKKFDRKNLWNWSSMWNKPLVWLSSWSFTLLVNPTCKSFVVFDPFCLIQVSMPSQLRLSQVTCCRYSHLLETLKNIAC